MARGAGKRKKSAICKEFAKGRKRLPVPEPIRISREHLAEIGINAGLGRLGHRAMDEVQAALRMIGGGRLSKQTLILIDKSVSANRSDDDGEALWQQFRLWYWHCSLHPATLRQRDAVILFATGHGKREIEIALRVRKGAGKAAEMIAQGCRVYCELAGWIKSPPPPRKIAI